MQVTLTSPQEVMFANDDFKEVVVKIEHYLKEGRISTDPCNGWGEHVRVPLSIPDWMRPTIASIYEPMGWTLVFKFANRVMFMLPTSVV